MYTLVQDGITPLTAVQMDEVVKTLHVFFQESLEDGPISFGSVVDACHDPDSWWTDFPRMPTALELMAGCCSLEVDGIIQTEFIDGILHFGSNPCNGPTK